MRHFSTCIRLEPSNEIYYSNRAAAHTALKNFRGALSDGKEVVRLKPRWAKGRARIAAAHFGLEEFQEVSAQACSQFPGATVLLGCAVQGRSLLHLRLLCCMFMQGKMVAPERRALMLMSKRVHAGGYVQAREAYEKALELEPDDKSLQEARHRAHVAEHKAMEVHRHKFKRREPDSAQRQVQGTKKKPQQMTAVGSAKTAAGVTNKSKLSFGEDEESEDA